MEDLASQAGKVFLQEGLLGALILLLGLAVIFLYREKAKCEDKRYEELTKILEARENMAKAMNANTLALEATNRAMEARTRASEEIAREVEDLRRIVESAVQQGGFWDKLVHQKLDDILKRLETLVGGR